MSSFTPRVRDSSNLGPDGGQILHLPLDLWNALCDTERRLVPQDFETIFDGIAAERGGPSDHHRPAGLEQIGDAHRPLHENLERECGSGPAPGRGSGDKLRDVVQMGFGSGRHQPAFDSQVVAGVVRVEHFLNAGLGAGGIGRRSTGFDWSRPLDEAMAIDPRVQRATVHQLGVMAPVCQPDQSRMYQRSPIFCRVSADSPPMGAGKV